MEGRGCQKRLMIKEGNVRARARAGGDGDKDRVRVETGKKERCFETKLLVSIIEPAHDNDTITSGH